MPRWFFAVVPVALAIALAVAAVPARAGGLGFLRKSAVTYFQQDDSDLMMRNARKVLDAPAADAESSWSNPRTGASGLARITQAFTATDGAPCRRLHVVNRAKGVEDESTYTVCHYEQRGWVMHADAKPAS